MSAQQTMRYGKINLRFDIWNSTDKEFNHLRETNAIKYD